MFTMDMISEKTREMLTENGVTEFSDIQKAVIPLITSGRDVLVQAPTGSGKTYTFLVPVLESIIEQGKGKHLPDALILAPTRELCLQTADVCRSLLKNREGIRTAVLCGGTDISRQIRANSRGADIVIGTPARICDHLRRHTLKTKMISRLILDEADQTLSMGFHEDVMKVIGFLPEHQTVMLSATWNDDVRSLAQEILHEPETVMIENHDRLTQDIEIYSYIVPSERKLSALFSVLRQEKTQTVVFCNRRNTADFVSAKLREAGLDAEAIHSEMDYGRRKKIMSDFRTGKLDILCATDVAARGIDVPETGLIVNYDYPDQKEHFMHRIGRTARRMHRGKAVTLLSEKEKYLVREMEELSGRRVRKYHAGSEVNP